MYFLSASHINLYMLAIERASCGTLLITARVWRVVEKTCFSLAFRSIWNTNIFNNLHHRNRIGSVKQTSINRDGLSTNQNSHFPKMSFLNPLLV